MTKTGTLNQDHEVTIWGSTITLPKGTKLKQVNQYWAVQSIQLLIQLTGNTHDPEYRYCFVPADLVTHG